MGMTSRRKRPLKRDIPFLRDTSLIVIASEGKVTEKAYFESELFNSIRVQVKVLETKDGFSSPKAVYRRLRDFKKKYQLDNSDKLWLVIDRDRWKIKNLRIIASEMIKLGASLALSNPSFELWLYLHFADWTGGVVSSSEIENSLRGLLGVYNKSSPPISRFANRTNEACLRAEKMDVNSNLRWPNNPGSHVYRLVKDIAALK